MDVLESRYKPTVYWRWQCLNCDSWLKDDVNDARIDHWKKGHEAHGHRVVLVPPFTDARQGWDQ